MVRRPWLRRTRLLAGAPTASPSGRPALSPPAELSADVPVADVAAAALEEPLGVAAFLVPEERAGALVADAGSRRTLGDPMPGGS